MFCVVWLTLNAYDAIASIASGREFQLDLFGLHQRRVLASQRAFRFRQDANEILFDQLA